MAEATDKETIDLLTKQLKFAIDQHSFTDDDTIICPWCGEGSITFKNELIEHLLSCMEDMIDHIENKE